MKTVIISEEGVGTIEQQGKEVFAELYPSGGTCALCRKKKELRPYGPNGENICFDCGMKDEQNTKLRFSKLVQ